MAPLSALQRLVGLGCATSAATATRPATTRRGGVEELLNEPGDYESWTLKGFLEDRGGNACLERARSAGGNVLPDFQLLERCAHSQAMRRLGNLRGHLNDESKKGKKRSLGVPGPGLIASSTRAWTTLLTNVADGALDVTPSDRTSRPRAP